MAVQTGAVKAKPPLPPGIVDLEIYPEYIIVELKGKQLKVTTMLAVMRYIEMHNIKKIIFNYKGKKLFKLEKDY